MAKPTALVTGGAGFIGSHIVDALLAAGHSVAVVDNLSTGHRANVAPRARFHEVDLHAPGLAQAFDAERPALVVHAAAQASVARSMADPLLDSDVNVIGSLKLLEQCVRLGVRMVTYITTGGALYGDPQYLPCDEAHPVNPISPYGVSKFAVEKYLFAYRHNYGLQYTVLRLANVYGPRQDPFGEAGVVSIFAQKMLAGEQAVVFGTGLQERDFVYVGDCARAAILALEGPDQGTYNIGSGTGISINSLYELICELTGCAKGRVHGPPRPGDVVRSYLDASKARQELGWQPEVSLREGLDRTLAWMRERLS